MEEESELRRAVEQAREEQAAKSPQLRLLTEIRDLLAELVGYQCRPQARPEGVEVQLPARTPGPW